MNGDGGNVQFAPLGPFIQCLNVFQAMFEPVTAEIDFVLRDRVEHKRVIRIGRMAERKNVGAVPLHLVTSSGFRFRNNQPRTRPVKAMRRCHLDLRPKNKTAAARIRAAADCIEEPLTSLTAFLNNSLSDCLRLAASGGSSQAER